MFASLREGVQSMRTMSITIEEKLYCGPDDVCDWQDLPV